VIAAWRQLTLRSRLTAAFALVFGAMLLAYALAVYLLIRDRFAAELDHRLDQEVEIAERSIGRDVNGRLAWRNAHNSEEGEWTRNVAWIDVWRADGTLALRRQDAATGSGETSLPSLDIAWTGLRSLELPGEVHLRLLQRRVSLEGEMVLVRAALREDDFARGLVVVLWVMAGGLPVALLVAGAGGYWLAGRGLAPIHRMAGEAEAIHAGRLDARLPVDNPFDEPGRLAVAFNALLARLEAAFGELRRFTADASHELRTPLTVIRSVGEVGLREPHSEAEYRNMIGTMLEEVDRLTLLTTMLLELTRSECGRAEIKCAQIDLRELIRDAAGFLGVLAEEGHVCIDLDLPEIPVLVSGDWTMLRQALINLLDNAIKHSPPGATVTLACQAGDERMKIGISDQGDGIPVEHLPHVFERFYRVDTSRSQDGSRSGGFGLGLAIARWAVEAHGGQIVAKSSLGKGARFEISLPPLQRSFETLPTWRGN
jgi:heavy metal sensor kinase